MKPSEVPAMRGEDVPPHILEAARGGYSMHGAGLIANLVAAAWPEIRRAVFADLFGTPEEIAARKADAANRKADDPVALMDRVRPGWRDEIERQVRATMGERLIATFQAMREDGEHDMRTVIERVRDEMTRGERP